MTRDPRMYLHDMLEACRFLLEFTVGKSVADYKADRGFRSAVERELQIIGEAVLQLQSCAPDLAAKISEHEQIIHFRHVLVHGYHSLKPQLVWDVIETKLPNLQTELEAMLPGTE